MQASYSQTNSYLTSSQHMHAVLSNLFYELTMDQVRVGILVSCVSVCLYKNFGYLVDVYTYTGPSLTWSLLALKW